MICIVMLRFFTIFRSIMEGCKSQSFIERARYYQALSDEQKQAFLALPQQEQFNLLRMSFANQERVKKGKLSMQGYIDKCAAKKSQKELREKHHVKDSKLHITENGDVIGFIYYSNLKKKKHGL